MCTVSDRIFELIVLRLSGEQTLEEEQELNTWIGENPRHRVMWEEYQRLNLQIKSLNQPVQVDVESALRQVKVPRTVLLSWKKIATWAAVLLLPLCVGIWLFLNSASEESSRLFSEVASPGGGKAILKLGGQEQIFLNGGTDTLIIAGNGTKIKTDTGNMLSYQVSSNDKCLATADNQLIVPRGGEYRITLGDGTRVWLNSASVLTFPQAFTGSERRVMLSGEAYFEVNRDARHPFIVSTAQMDIKVLGTSFNVSAYKDEEMVQATLIKGSVEVRSPGRQELILTPGQQACLSGGEMICKEVNVRQFTSWVDGKFMFCNTPLEEISRQISRWYDVDIFFSNENVKAICFTGAILRFEPLEQLIRMIENTSNVHFSIKGKTIVISEQ